MFTELAIRLNLAFAPAPEGAPDDGTHTMVLMIFYGGLFAVLYFFLIRPQTKKTREIQDMQEGLGKGDAVVTSGGIFGTVYKIKDDVVTLQIADDVRVKVQRSAVLEMNKKIETSEKDE